MQVSKKFNAELAYLGLKIFHKDSLSRANYKRPQPQTEDKFVIFN